MKYSKKQLSEMAKTYINDGSGKGQILITMLSMMTGLRPSECDKRIRELANETD